MQWTQLYATNDNVALPFRDRQGYIWLYKWDGDNRILRSDAPNGSTFSLVATARQSIRQFLDDSHGRVFAVTAANRVEYWNGSTWGLFGTEKVSYLAIDKDDNLYSIYGTAIKKCLYGSTTFNAYTTAPYSAHPIFVNQDYAIYIVSGVAKAIQKMPLSGSFADIGADSVAWSYLCGGLFDGRKYLRNSENDFVYRAVDGSDAFSQYIEFTGLATPYTISADYYGNLFTYNYTTNFKVFGLKYGITYNGNGNTGGDVPTDSLAYYAHDNATAKTNSGSLVKSAHKFLGWNTAADGSGTHYNVGATITMTADDLTLYAEWEAAKAVTYNGNGNTGGTAPVDATEYYDGDQATAKANSGNLEKTGSTFTGWNTAADGSGTHYGVGDSVPMIGNLTLYAEWRFTITYNGNGNNTGTVPTDANYYDAGDPATILGNTGTLAKDGMRWLGWNTAADGSGTHYNAAATITVTASLTLYAEWAVQSQLEDMVSAFVAYVKAYLPGKITVQNYNETTTAPALIKIEKGVMLPLQRLPSAVIYMETAQVDEEGQGSRSISVTLSVAIAVATKNDATTETYLERYMDALFDLATSAMVIPGSEYILHVVDGDKGVEADGTSGWVVVQFRLESEMVF